MRIFFSLILGFIFLLSMFLSPTSFAEEDFSPKGDWQYIESTLDGNTDVYLDTARDAEDNKILFWVKFAGSNLGPKGEVTELDEFAVSCKNKRKIYSKQSYGYDTNGKLVTSRSAEQVEKEGISTEYDVNPGTIFSDLIQQVCGN